VATAWGRGQRTEARGQSVKKQKAESRNRGRGKSACLGRRLRIAIGTINWVINAGDVCG
jgi:hypothetical protein